jgi:hypothetical protein
MHPGNERTPDSGRQDSTGRRGPVPRLAAAPAVLRLLALCVAGCGAGSGEGLDVGGRPLGEAGEIPLAAALPSLQVHVFDAACTVCHAGAAAPLGLRLDAANSYTNLVGVPSRQVGSLLRVAPGNPDASYLVRKLEGTASEGERMPLGGPPIPAETIAYVRQWIADGAAPDAPAGGGAPLIVSLDPAPGSVLTEMPAAISVGFSTDIDASTVHAGTLTLEQSGGDGSFDDGNEVPLVLASVGLSPGNPRLSIADLTGAEPVEDRYRLSIRGSGANVIQGVDGAVLDGEFSGSFPSGDGTEGGDFVATFAVEGVQPTLESVQATIFSPTCAAAGCHTGPTGGPLPAGMDLGSADASFAALVGVASIQDPTQLRVAPGDPDASYLVAKIEGTAGTGGRMPLGGAALDATAIDAIRAWIDAGAER